MQIAFTSRRDGVDHVYITDGTITTQLTHGAYPDNYLSWSFDGTKIAYEHSENGIAIYTMNADGSNQKRLSGSAAKDTKPSWSPDGTKIVYSWISDPNSQPPKTELRTMKADGTGVRTLLKNGLSNFEPHYSPDGTKIVFFAGPINGGMQICTINADGSHFTALTNEPFVHGDPSWSPDGKTIVFGSNRQGGGLLNMFRINADGSNLVQLSNFPLGQQVGDAGYSKDGTVIAFEHAINSGYLDNPTAPAEVWIMNADGSNPHSTGQACSCVGCCPRPRP